MGVATEKIVAFFAQQGSSLLGQTEKVLDKPDWWLDRGVLGAFAFLIVAGVVWGIREVWTICKPGMVARQKILTERETKLNTLLDSTIKNDAIRLEHDAIRIQQESSRIAQMEKMRELIQDINETQRGIAETQKQHLEICRGDHHSH